MRYLCGFCQKAYLNENGECPNGCTTQFSKVWNQKVEKGDTQGREVLGAKLQRALDVAAANLWWQRQKGRKPKPHETTDTDTDTSAEDESTSTTDAECTCNELNGWDDPNCPRHHPS